MFLFDFEMGIYFPSNSWLKVMPVWQKSCMLSFWPSHFTPFGKLWKKIYYRNLKTSLLDAERYREELRVLQDEIAVLTQKIEKSRADLDKAKEDLRQARLQGAMPQSKTKGPKFNKDTKVCTKHTAFSDWLGKPQKKFLH